MVHGGLDRIADAAQVSHSAVQDAYYGPRGAVNRHDAPPRQFVNASVARRILSVTPEQIVTAFVDPTGTVRRLQALVAIGYSQTEIAERLGVHTGNLSPLIHGKRPRVSVRTYASTRALFVELWAHPVTGHAGDRPRAIAASRKWVGPLAWDDIDDPAEIAKLGGAKSKLIDDVAVELAMNGEPIQLNLAERREAVTRLYRRRWSDNRIADALHISDRTVLRYRQELGLESFDFCDIKKVGAA
jgi:DNA-binding NarL/FixJ family response regulator